MRFWLFFKRRPPWNFLCGWFLFPLLLFTSAGNAQQVSLSVKGAPLVTVFEQIRKQTGYTFLYTSEGLNDARPVTVSFAGLPLAQALATVFAGQPFQYSIDQTYVAVRPGPIGLPKQALDIKGRVQDEGGAGLAGVSVGIKGSNEGTTTDGAGTFVLKTARDQAQLTVTAVGYEPQTFTVRESTVLAITLKTAVGKLDEQVIIAYGTTTRRTATGTVGKVRGEEVSKQPVSNPLLALGGRVSGLQVVQSSGVPGSDVTVLLRGQNSLANGNNPLYIVDGIPYPSVTLSSSYGGGAGVVSSPLNNLAVADIESIEVLKDADATAIYGSRGANGVILITTKRGRAGKTTTDVSVYQGVGSTTRLATLLATPAYLRMRREGFANDGVAPTTANARDLLLWDTTRYTDWQKVLIGNKAHVFNATATVSGGSASTQFLLGAGYRRETTVYAASFGETKVSAQAGFNHATSDNRLRLSFHTQYTYDRNVLPQVDVTSLITLAPDAPPLYDSAGALNWAAGTWDNPLSYFEKKYKTTTETLLANFVVERQISPRLLWKTSVGYTSSAQTELITTPYKSYDPAFLQYAYVYTGFGTNRLKTLIVEPQATYRNTFGKKGNLALLAGGTFQQNNQQALLQTGSGFASDATTENIKAASSVTVDNNSDIDYRYLGLFARLTAEWDRKYILNLTARRDGSSRYGPANRFASFGSVGGAWVFSDEKIFSPLRGWLSYGKLKGSYGITGNDQIGDYQYLSTYSAYAYPYQGVSTLYPTGLSNPDFRWEKVTKREFSLDLGFWKDRVLLTANYYHNITTNQLVQYGLPSMTGFSGVLQNIPARIRNSGWELELNATLKKNASLEWTTSFSVTFPQSKLLAYEGLENSSYASSYEVGQPLFIAKRFHLTGVDPATGLYTFEDFDKDGAVSFEGDQKAIVNTSQQYFGGFQNTVKFKSWQLSLFFQFVGQQHASNYLSRFTSKPGALSNQPEWVWDRWQQEGDQAGVQKFSNANFLTNVAYSRLRFSDAAFDNASFLRLKNVFLSYDWAPSRGNGTAGWRIRFYAQAQNLFTWTAYKGLDPETRAVLPPLKLVTGGLQFIF